MASGKKGNGSGDSSSKDSKLKPSGQGYDPAYQPGQGKMGHRRVSSVDTYASIASGKPTKGSELAYAVGMTRKVVTNATNYEPGRKEPKGLLK